MTVSRVLHGHPLISDATRLRVQQAIRELNYRPNSIARALATQRAMCIGVLLGGPLHHGPNSTLRALEHAARKVGYTVATYPIYDDEDTLTKDGIMQLVGQGIDALCVIGPRASTLAVLAQLPAAPPTIVVKAEADDIWSTVAVDQRSGAALAVRHLLELGHRSIAHLAGPPDSYDAREREGGWRDALASADLPAGPVAIGDWTSEAGFRFGQQFGPSTPITAVFSDNDEMALGLIHGLADRGLRVPDDVSVIGFDDLPDARHFLSPLTTVHQDFAALGELLLQHVIGAIRGTAAQPERIMPTLTVRDSTATPSGPPPREGET